jgi:hypothetical protein
MRAVSSLDQPQFPLSQKSWSPALPQPASPASAAAIPTVGLPARGRTLEFLIQPTLIVSTGPRLKASRQNRGLYYVRLLKSSVLAG